MRLIRQDARTEDTCGQCSLAMLLGISKREAIALVGRDDGTTTSEMRAILRRKGRWVAPRLRKFVGFEAIPTRHALLLGYWKKYPHWFVWNEGRVFCPVEGIIDLNRKKLPARLRITHYLPVKWSR
jgi:hypothetical protein